MAADSDNPLGALSTVLTGTLGVLVALIEELGRAGAIDRDRLLSKVKDVLAEGEGEPLGATEARMNGMLLAVFAKALEKPNE